MHASAEHFANAPQLLASLTSNAAMASPTASALLCGQSELKLVDGSTVSAESVLDGKAFLMLYFSVSCWVLWCVHLGEAATVWCERLVEEARESGSGTMRCIPFRTTAAR